MGCRIYYKYDGAVPDTYKSRLPSDLDRTTRILDGYWAELLAMAAATPPVDAVAECGDRYPYSQFLAEKFLSFREHMEDYYREKVHMEDCLQVMEESPDKVWDSD